LKLSKASAVVMSVSVVSAVFGLLRESVVAALFGTSLESDAYFFAFDLSARLPEFLVPAIAGALIPVYLRSKREEQDDRFTMSVINAYMLALIVFNLGLFLFSSGVVSVMGSGFETDQRALVVEMVRLISPALTLLGIAGMLRSLLNAEGRFLAAQISHVWLSIGIVAAGFWVAPRIGVGGLAAGVVAGALLQVGWTAFWLWKSGFRYHFVLDLRDDRFRRFTQLLLPGLVGGVLSYALPILDKFLASYLPAGGIATLSFASKPVALLSRIGINSIVVAALPVLTSKVLEEGPDSYRSTLGQTLRLSMFTILPMSVILVALRAPVIEILFQRGAFDAQAALETSATFAAAVLQLAPAGVAVVLSTAFNAVEDVKTPAYFGAGGNIVVKLAVAPPLMAALGTVGLALSTTIMYSISAVILMVLYRRKLPHLRLDGIAPSFTRSILASAVAWGATEIAVRSFDLGAIPTLVVGGVVGAVAFVAAAAAVRSPELSFIFLRTRRVLQRSGS